MSKAEEGVEEPTVKPYDGAAIPMPFKPLSNDGWDASKVKIERVHPGVTVIRNMMTAEECEYLRNKTDETGMVDAGYDHSYRNNLRLSVISREFASILWERAKDHIPEDMKVADEAIAAQVHGRSGAGVWKACSVNECFRICRYSPGGHFGPHCDATYQRTSEERSMTTFMFYLNGGFTGGTTNIIKPDAELHKDSEGRFSAAEEDIVARVVPEPGLLMVMWQGFVLHEGAVLESGTKYLLRSDVMFKREPGTKPEMTEAETKARELLDKAMAAEAANNLTESRDLYMEAYRLDPELERGVE